MKRTAVAAAAAASQRVHWRQCARNWLRDVAAEHARTPPDIGPVPAYPARSRDARLNMLSLRKDEAQV